MFEGLRGAGIVGVSLKMREDFQEALEKMFPEGFLILYPAPKGFRMLLVADKETEYCKELSEAWAILRRAENEAKEHE